MSQALAALTKLAGQKTANPYGEDYPEGVYPEIHMTLSLNNGVYMLHCPEWHYEAPAGRRAAEVGRRVAKLVEEIVAHNEAEIALELAAGDE